MMKIALALWFVFLFSANTFAGESQQKITQASKESFISKLEEQFPKVNHARLIEGLGGELSKDYRSSDGSYFLYVPDDYDSKQSYPLMLAISPNPEGKDMFGTWSEAAKKYKFIFACPNRAGNETRVAERAQRVLDTLADVRSKYKISEDKIFITGFSGGSRMSTGLVLAFPDLFSGHIPIGGVFFGANHSELKQLKTKLGFYLFAGEKDPNRGEAEATKKSFDKDGVSAELMIGRGIGHETPDAKQGLQIYEWFLNKMSR